jgi:hypothetical protein
MLIRIRDSYIVAEGPVTLDVSLGEGQKGFIEVLLSGKVLASGTRIEGLELGDGQALAGQKLRITSTVTDTNPMTNRTSVTYRLSGGKSDRRYMSRHEVDSEGDTVDYDAIFLLI